MFQPSSPSTGPFPSNILTVASAAQKTGLRVNLPIPAGCTAVSVSGECINAQLLNQLDGFSVNPRITVCFSDAVDTDTLTAGITLRPVGASSHVTAMDRWVYDPSTNCVHAKPAQILAQDTNYILAITAAVTDIEGKRLKSDKLFSDCIKKPDTDYCRNLSDAVNTANLSGPGNSLGDLVGASLFTTMSATAWLEQARAQVISGAIPGAGSLAAPMATFDLQSDVQSITWVPQSGVTGVDYSQPLPLSVLSGVQSISFGAVLSPLYLNISGPQAGSISTLPATAQPVPTLVEPVSFHVFLPAAPADPAAKIPVIIFGHGLGDNQFGAPTFAASSWAQKGFATIAMEIPGHGFGPLSFAQIVAQSGNYTIPTPGRGIQFSPTAPIGPQDGCILPNAIATRDCSRQTTVDLIALIRAIQTTQGLGLNLDSSRIYYAGQSFGALYGTLLTAVEPAVAAATLNSGGGSQADAARLSPIARQLGAAYLASFTPPLLNVPPAAPQAYFHDGFNDEYCYSGQIVNTTVPGAPAIQDAFEQAEWLGMLGDPLSYAPHLQTAPLAGMPSKPTLVQFGLGDLEVPNPTESALVRAGSLEKSTWMLRTDLAAAIDPQLLGLVQPGIPFPIYPHRFLSNPTVYNPASPALGTAIALAAQQQIADFFVSNGKSIQDPNQYFTGPFAGQTLFQVPTVMPQALNFFQIQP